MTTLLRPPDVSPPPGTVHPPGPGATRPWLHALAWVTVISTIPLLLLGAKVTSFKVGMADPMWPTPPGYLGYLYTQGPVEFGRVLEDSHREVGFVVGMCSIALAAGAWFGDRRRWVGWFGVAILLDVIVQGLLGGFRVRLHDLLGTDLAFLHGIHGQLAFGLMVGFAVVTSRGWATDVGTVSPEAARPLRVASAVLLGTLVVQLVLGAWLRHVGSTVSQRLHFLMAFAVVSVVTGVLRVVREGYRGDVVLMRSRTALMVLLGIQILFGVEAWMLRFGPGAPSEYQAAAETGPVVRSAMVRSAHVLIGAFLLATAVVLALRVYRVSYRPAAQGQGRSAVPVEGVV